MKLKSRKKPASRPLPLAAVGAGLAALGGLIAFLGSRNRREKAKGALKDATASVRHSGREYDDVTLARKVESEILGGEDAPKGSVVVNASDGVVELRGQVKRPEDVRGLGDAAAKVAGVKDVNNLLHTAGSEPKTSPPSDPAEVRERAEHS
jgi:osmotically-inducible protein OsmY